MDTWTNTNNKTTTAWQAARSMSARLICCRNSSLYFYFLWGETNRKVNWNITSVLCIRINRKRGRRRKWRKKMDRMAVSQQKLSHPHGDMSSFLRWPYRFCRVYSHAPRPPLAAPAFLSAVKLDRYRDRDKQWNNVHHLIATWSLFICCCWEIDICQESNCQRISLPAQTWWRPARMRPCWSLLFPIR